MTGRQRACLTVYGRTWCHLCEDLLSRLGPVCAELGADIEVIDVEGHAGLEEVYGERVPVVMGGDKELCHYFLDEAAVRAYLLNFR